MKQVILLFIGLFLLSFQQVKGQDLVSLKIEKFGGGDLPEDSRVIVVSQKGSKRIGTKDNLLPTLGDSWKPKYDELNAQSKTKKSYPVTKAIDGEVYFVYVLTPDEEIFYSAAQNGNPEYKQVVAGLIYVKKLLYKHPQREEVFAAFNPKVKLKIRDKATNQLLPDDTGLVVFTKERTYAQEFLYPERQPSTFSDVILQNGQSGKVYEPTNSSNKRYFIYALTPNKNIYFTSDRADRPLFDVLVSGDMSLTELKEEAVYRMVAANYFGIIDEMLEMPKPIVEPEDNGTSIVPEPEEPEEEPEEIVEVIETDETLEKKEEHSWIFGLVLLGLFLIPYFLLRKQVRLKHVLNFVYLGFISTFLAACLTNSFPLIFATVGLLLGGYFLNAKREKRSDLVYVLCAFVMGGFAYSFFFQAVIGDIVLEGSMSKSIAPPYVLTFLLSIAAAVLVHSFCISLLTFGTNNRILKLLVYISVLFLVPLYFGVSVFDTQVALVHYIFFVLVMTLLINLASNSKYSNSLEGAAIPLALGSVMLNYFIPTAILAGGTNFLIESEFLKSGRLTVEDQKSSRLLMIGTFFFHIAYFSLGGFITTFLLGLVYRKQVMIQLSLPGMLQE